MTNSNCFTKKRLKSGGKMKSAPRTNLESWKVCFRKDGVKSSTNNSGLYSQTLSLIAHLENKKKNSGGSGVTDILSEIKHVEKYPDFVISAHIT